MLVMDCFLFVCMLCVLYDFVGIGGNFVKKEISALMR